MDDKGLELYKKHRPRLFKDVIGQPEAIKQLKEMTDNNRIPRSLMLTGGSGTGKTTLVRILKEKLKCSDQDYHEINCASVESPIETIREIERNMGLSPWGGPCRVWLWDELQAWSKAGFAQQAALKILEDTPRHCYFFICTTDPDKLLPAIKTRCTKIELKPLGGADMQTVLANVCDKEGIKVSQKVLDRIIQVAKGSPREALVQLNAVMGLKSEQEQIAAIFSDDVEKKAFDLAKLLMDKNSKWPDVMAMIDKIEEDPEAIRHCVMGYASGCLRRDKTPGRGYLILEAFKGNFFDSKKNGLIWACAEVYRQE